MIYYFPVIVYVAAWILAWIISMLTGSPFVTELWRFVLFLSVGMQGIWAFIGHVFIADEAAAHIGWKSSPFQFEIGIANLSYGAMGLPCLFFSSFWVPVSIGYAVFLLGAAWGHVLDMKRSNNFAPGNAGPIFFMDLIVPATLLYVAIASI